MSPIYVRGDGTICPIVRGGTMIPIVKGPILIGGTMIPIVRDGTMPDTNSQMKVIKSKCFFKRVRSTFIRNAYAIMAFIKY